MKKAKHPTSNIQHPTPNEAAENVWVMHEGGGSDERKFDLEERLLAFASTVIDLSEKRPSSRAGNHVAGQILRSGTSPYPSQGKAEDAESRDDFIHKLKICLKEVRETRRWVQLIRKQGWAKDEPALLIVLREPDELIRVFFSSIQTTKRNALTERRRPTGSYPSSEAG